LSIDKEISPLQFIKGVGPKRAKAFEKEGFKTPEQLLTYFPVNYIDRTGVISVRELYKRLSEPNSINIDLEFASGLNLSNEFTLVAKVVDKTERRFGILNS
jgi:RecG-like helicase